MSGLRAGYVPVAAAINLFNAEGIPFVYSLGGVCVGSLRIPTVTAAHDGRAVYCVMESRVLAVVFAVRYARSCGMGFIE